MFEGGDVKVRTGVDEGYRNKASTTCSGRTGSPHLDRGSRGRVCAAPTTISIPSWTDNKLLVTLDRTAQKLTHFITVVNH